MQVNGGSGESKSEATLYLGGHRLHGGPKLVSQLTPSQVLDVVAADSEWHTDRRLRRVTPDSLHQALWVTPSPPVLAVEHLREITTEEQRKRQLSSLGDSADGYIISNHAVDLLLFVGKPWFLGDHPLFLKGPDLHKMQEFGKRERANSRAIANRYRTMVRHKKKGAVLQGHLLYYMTFYHHTNRPAYVAPLFVSSVLYDTGSEAVECYLTMAQLHFPLEAYLTDVVRDHMAMLHTPSILTVVATDGRPLRQNASSVGFYGNIAHNRTTDARSVAASSFWDALFEGNEESRVAMFKALECWEPSQTDTVRWCRRLHVRVPLPASWLASQRYQRLTSSLLTHHQALQNGRGQPPPPAPCTGTNPHACAHVWHDVTVIRLRDVLTHQLDFVVIQTAAGEAQAAQEHLGALQARNRALLHRLLPQHVATALLSGGKYTPRGPPSARSVFSQVLDLQPANARSRDISLHLSELARHSAEYERVAENSGLDAKAWEQYWRRRVFQAFRTSSSLQGVAGEQVGHSGHTGDRGARRRPSWRELNVERAAGQGGGSTVTTVQTTEAEEVEVETALPPVAEGGLATGEGQGEERQRTVSWGETIVRTRTASMRGGPQDAGGGALDRAAARALEAAGAEGARQDEEGNAAERREDEGEDAAQVETSKRGLVKSLTLRVARESTEPPSPPFEVTQVARFHPSACILFADIKGFTSLAHTLPPRAVMHMLNRLYFAIDAWLPAYNVTKVETIGDCYVAATGMTVADSEWDQQPPRADGTSDCASPEGGLSQTKRARRSARSLLAFGRALLEAASNLGVNMRVGLHVGPVMSGVVGQRMPRFCLLGGTMAEADSLQGMGRPGRIVASAKFASLLAVEQWTPLPHKQEPAVGMPGMEAMLLEDD